MRFLADYLAEYIVNKKHLKEGQFEIYRFGFLVAFELIICILSSMLIAILLAAFFEYLYVLVVLFTLRFYFGGFHFQHCFSCFILSTFVLDFPLVIMDYFVFHQIIYIILFLSCIFALFLGVRLSEHSDFKSVRENLFFLKKRRIIIIVITLLNTYFLIFKIEKYLFLSIFCILIVAVSLFIKIFLKRKS